MENSNAKKCNWCVHINTCKFRGSNEYNADSCSFYYTIDVFGESVFKEIGKKIDILIKILKPKEDKGKLDFDAIMKEPKLCERCKGSQRVLRNTTKEDSGFVRCPDCEGTGYDNGKSK